MHANLTSAKVKQGTLLRVAASYTGQQHRPIAKDDITISMDVESLWTNINERGVCEKRRPNPCVTLLSRVHYTSAQQKCGFIAGSNTVLKLGGKPAALTYFVLNVKTCF